MGGAGAAVGIADRCDDEDGNDVCGYTAGLLPGLLLECGGRSGGCGLRGGGGGNDCWLLYTELLVLLVLLHVVRVGLCDGAPVSARW